MKYSTSSNNSHRHSSRNTASTKLLRPRVAVIAHSNETSLQLCRVLRRLKFLPLIIKANDGLCSTWETSLRRFAQFVFIDATHPCLWEDSNAMLKSIFVISEEMPVMLFRGGEVDDSLDARVYSKFNVATISNFETENTKQFISTAISDNLANRLKKQLESELVLAS